MGFVVWVGVVGYFIVLVVMFLMMKCLSVILIMINGRMVVKLSVVIDY